MKPSQCAYCTSIMSIKGSIRPGYRGQKVEQKNLRLFFVVFSSRLNGGSYGMFTIIRKYPTIGNI